MEIVINRLNVSDMESAVSERLLEIIKYYGLNRNSFSVKLGHKNNAQISKATRPTSKGISQKLMQEILEKFPEIDALWLITGEGQMLKDMHVVKSKNEGHVESNCNECEKLKARIIMLEDTINNLNSMITHLKIYSAQAQSKAG